jgi:hypothetical protein
MDPVSPVVTVGEVLGQINALEMYGPKPIALPKSPHCREPGEVRRLAELEVGKGGAR